MLGHRKRLSVAIGALFIVGTASLAGYHLSAGPARASAPPPAIQVDVAAVTQGPVTDWQNYSGRLDAVERIDIRPQVAGAIVAVHVRDGGLVKKGEALFTIDPRPYQAEVDRAEAQLAAAQTRAAYATDDAARAERLLASEAIAKRDYDARQNIAREAAANLKAAKAALETAKINLAYTEITAPVAGRVSRAELTVGNIVASGSAAPLLATLVSVSPIYASFDVDEQTYLRYVSRASNSSAPVFLGLADEDGYSRRGRVVSVDNHLDPVSGTIRVRARFDNEDGSLVPGLYARIKVGGGAEHSALMISDTAIGTDQAKKFVLTVGADARVQYREIKLGGLHDGLREVTAGLEAGDRIVVNGVQRVRPNDAVEAHPVAMTGASTASAQ